MERLFCGSVATLVERWRSSSAEDLQAAHKAIFAQHLATLRACGFEPPEDAPSGGAVDHLCQIADAALIFAQAKGAPLQAETAAERLQAAETAAECLQAIAAFYMLMPEALEPDADGASIARLAAAASMIGIADSQAVNARMGVFDQASGFDIRKQSERRAGREGARMRHGARASRDAALRARYEAAKEAGSSASPSGWAKSIEGKPEALGLKWRAIFDALKRATPK